MAGSFNFAARMLRVRSAERVCRRGPPLAAIVCLLAGRYACGYDGLLGEWCDTHVEHYCLLQCSGHGRCWHGFCKCYDGWYGADCSRRAKGLPIEPGDQARDKPYLKAVLPHPQPLPAQQPPPAPTRRRPLIYVYDMSPEFTTDLLQYRLARDR